MESVEYKITFDMYDNFTEDFEELSDMVNDSFEERCYTDSSRDFNKIFLPTVYGLIFILGIIGNGLVIVVMGYQKKVKTMTDKYRLHLSVADLLFVLTLPFWAVDAASSWYFGGFMCVSVNMIYTINLYSSVFILAFISLDRYLAVMRPTDSHVTRQTLANKVIYLAVWLPAAALTVPDLVFARTQSKEVFVIGHDEQTKDSRVICQRFYPENSNVWTAVFHLQHVLVGFMLPGLVILVCYCIIISRLSQGVRVHQLKKKVLKTTIILIVCFFSCWLPYCLGLFVDTLVMLNVLSPTCEMVQVLEKWISITEALAYFHCCLNPILYAFLGVKFKKSAKSALTISSKSSQKATLMSKKRGPISSVSTESESSSALHS
ncbi:C-X-C chemokine receptor type 4b [Nelusetta ayraudi]|uniref:C-X-C chemokine receptor type 4b n=1 Tax=Nelusetta ayraudi TaxID=303726 RepID=UPI003F730292